MTDVIRHTEAKLGHWYSVTVTLPKYVCGEMMATFRRLAGRGKTLSEKSNPDPTNLSEASGV